MRPYILEIAVDSLESARAAAAGGADRIELCSRLDLGGLSPENGLVEAVKGETGLPVFVMLRPRRGDFHYDHAEWMQIIEDCARFGAAGADGFVCGLLDGDGTVPVKRLEALLHACGNKPLTFHRALDRAYDPDTEVAMLADAGVARVLSSGGEKTAAEGAARLGKWVRSLGDRMVVMPGGGVRPANLPALMVSTGAREFHLSALPPGQRLADAAIVAACRDILDREIAR